MIRKTLPILSLIGLLLSVALWGLSYWNLDGGFGSQSARLAGGGRLSRGSFLCYFEFATRVHGGYDWEIVGFRGFDTEWWPQFGASGTGVLVRIPLWMPTLLFGYLTWRLRFAPANLLRRRKKLGLCVKCGYDLRASKDRCPECGSTIDAR